MKELVVCWFGVGILLLAVSLSVFQLWQGVTSTLSATYFRPVHLSWIMVLVFLHYPVIKSSNHPLYLMGRVVDLLLSIAVVAAAYRMLRFDYNDINYLLYGLEPLDLAAGVVLLGLMLEACRRSVGWVMVFIAASFLAYSAFGDLLPGGHGDQNL